MFYCYQLFNNDCGYACVKMCLANAFHNKNYLSLIDEYKEDNYSMFELINIAQKYNVELKGYEVENLNDLFSHQKAICLIEENNRFHYVYFIKKKKKKIHLFDPKYGYRIMNIDEFSSLFTKKVLLINQIGKDNLTKKKKDSQFTYYLFFFMVNLFDFFLLTMTTFYVNSSSSLILVFLILCVFMITRVNKNIFIQFYMQNFDKKFLIPFLENEKFDKASYKIINEYKASYITYISSNVSTISTIIFLGYIFISDSLYHLFIMTIIILINFLIYLFKTKNNEVIKIAILEEELFVKKEKNYSFNQMQLSIKSHIFKESFIEIFIFIYSFLLVYFKMSFSNIDSFIYLVFYTFGYVEFSKNISQVFLFQEKKRKFIKNTSIFEIVFNKYNVKRQGHCRLAR
ncbi:MAG: cysteine peptidase family C39 domain-containing protein [Bacilli bacterium]